MAPADLPPPQPFAGDPPPDGQDDIQSLIALMARLPGLGPRSARRIVLQLVRRRSQQLAQLAQLMDRVARTSRECLICGNITDRDACAICTDPARATGEICVVQDVADLWALERGRAFKGRYHVLGGTLSALDEVGPDDLRIPLLLSRIDDERITEVILALSATVDGQTTAHYIADALAPSGVVVTGLAQGVPIGGELDYLDDGTITAALRARRTF
ncbi:recombination mediator RecR [Paracoccus nototheniae]|uniref:Recombination protein RecR n=1 Tax=Paracoccus nototheniae TaxID=2489002 RepID=A0ABW4E2X4_9RHOB|nr:recombination mediator RecR [Paracoccus nototheniae]